MSVTRSIEHIFEPLTPATALPGNATLAPPAEHGPGGVILGLVRGPAAPLAKVTDKETVTTSWSAPGDTKDGAGFNFADGNLTFAAKQSGGMAFKQVDFAVWQWAGVVCVILGIVCIATPIPDMWGWCLIGGGVGMAILGAFLPVYGPFIGLALVVLAVVGGLLDYFVFKRAGATASPAPLSAAEGDVKLAATALLKALNL